MEQGKRPESSQALSRDRFGRYRVGARIGVGAAASVYLARLVGPHNFGRHLALKVMHEHLMLEKEFVNLFLDEANLAVRLSHPNIVHVYELGRESERLFLAMELLQGQSLSAICARAKDRKTRIDPHLAAWIGARVADALHYAHHLNDDSGSCLGIIHRDVSPQNIFVTYDGQVKIIDFGIARAKGRLASTDHGKIRGKFRYMAPEQLLGSKFDERVDLFALCATIYELVAGQPAFAGDDETDVLQSLLLSELTDLRSLVPGVPENLARLLAENLSPEPDRRAQTGQQLASAFDRIAAESGTNDFSGRLAALVVQLFPSEKAEISHAIEQMGAAEPAVDSDPAAPLPSFVELEHTQLVAEAPSRTRRARVSAIALAAAAALIGAASFGVWRGRFAPSPLPAAPASVAIDIHVQPAVIAEIRVDGKGTRGRSTRSYLPTGKTPIQVLVSAPDYETASLDVVPDRDQFIVVPLLRTAASSAAPVLSASGGAPVLSANVEHSARVDLRPPATSSSSRLSSSSPSASSPRPVSPGAIVTDYPL